MVEITLQFDSDIQKQLTELQRRNTDLTPVMQRAATLMQGDVFRHFQNEEGESGHWKALKSATVKYKAKHGWSMMLQNTGRLRQSNYPSGGKDYAQILNDTIYAATHQFGRDKIPQREFLWVSDPAMEKISDMVGDYIMGAIK